MRAIVAVDNNWGIGKDNDLLFSIPEDMKFFREQTAGKVLLMGAKTLRSFPNGKPLKNRINIVLSRTMGTRDDCVVCSSVEQALKTIKQYNVDDVFVIGGGMIYEKFLPYCTDALVTKVNADGDAQIFFPNLDGLSNWICEEQSESLSSNGYEFKFTRYKNNQPLTF